MVLRKFVYLMLLFSLSLAPIGCLNEKSNQKDAQDKSYQGLADSLGFYPKFSAQTNFLPLSNLDTLFAQQSKTDTSKPHRKDNIPKNLEINLPYYLNCDTSKKQAHLDFKAEKFKILQSGLPVVSTRKDYYKGYLRKKYNIKFVNVGCTHYKGISCYNEIMKRLLKKRFGNIFKEARDTAHKKSDNSRLQRDKRAFKPSEVNQKPRFPGGKEALFEYIRKNIKYSKEAKNKNIEGTVVCKFIINANGRIENISIAKGVFKPLNQEAKRLIKNMPNWKPAIKNGEKVKTSQHLPIRFSLDR